MTFRTHSLIMHFITAASTGLLVWLYGHSTEQFDLMLIAIGTPLCVIVPAFVANWWLQSGLRKMRIQVDANHSFAEIRTGIIELDSLADEVSAVVDRNREGWDSIQRLLEQMSSANSPNGSARIVTMNGRLLTQALARISRSIAAEVGRILNHVNSISQRSHETTSDTQQQSQTIDQTIQYVEELSTNIDLILNNAESANRSAIDAREAAVHGQALIEKLIAGMNRIRSYMETGERKVLSLGERSQEISSIVETMGTLSTRTDMLALNASIEAVRAGEEGRGFSIVAEEVRKLAEHTSNASREIAELVESIQIETQDTIASMAKERAQVQEEVARVNEAGVALDRIRTTSSDSADRVGEISRITMEQLRGTQEMIQAMQQVSSLSQGMNTRSTKIRQTTTDIISVTRDLEQWISPMFHCDSEFRQESEERSEALVDLTKSRSESLIREESAELRTPVGAQS